MHELSTAGLNLQHSTTVAEAVSTVITPKNVNVVQFIACVLPVLGSRAGSVTCKFDKGVATSRTWPFYEATYQFTMREARTGRVITTLGALAGDATPENSCPGFATDDPDTVVARSLTGDALGAAVLPMYSGPA